jgi:hypothetical protein
MTAQTRHYIELSDITGIRLECKACGCSLSTNGDKDQKTVDNLYAATNVILLRCPTCRHSWTESENNPTNPFDSQFKEWVRNLRTLIMVEHSFGCKISLEIKPEAKA